jgi:hypothetical protein
MKAFGAPIERSRIRTCLNAFADELAGRKPTAADLKPNYMLIGGES